MEDNESNELDDDFGELCRRLLRDSDRRIRLPYPLRARILKMFERVCRFRRWKIAASVALSLALSVYAGEQIVRSFVLKFTPSSPDIYRTELVTTDVSISKGSDFTWEAWFRPGDLKLLENRIMGQTDWKGEGRLLVEVRNHPKQTGGKPMLALFLRQGGRNSRIVCHVELSPGWHHCAVTRRGDELKLYLDGVCEVSADNWTSGLIDGVPFCFAPAFNGELADVRVWNRVRTAEEISSERFRRLHGQEPGLLGYWPLSDGAPFIKNVRTGIPATVGGRMNWELRSR